MEVAVVDEVDGALPGVSVNFKRIDASGSIESETDPHGLVTAPLEPGQWQIDVNLAGFTHRRYTLAVARDQACKVTFHLLLDSRSAVTVT